MLQTAGIRADLDISNNKINYKVREHSTNKVPMIVVVGAKEQEARSVNVRRLGSEKQQSFELDEFVRQLTEETQVPL